MASSEKQKTGPSVSSVADNILLPVDAPLPSIATSNPPEIPLSPNPWQDDQASEKGKGSGESGFESIPQFDSSLLDQPSFAGLSIKVDDAPTPPNNISKDEVLNEFDPLANMEEKAARDAWADSEGHPPTHPPRTPSPPIPPMKDLCISSPTSPDGPVYITSPGSSPATITSPTPFASFASFAKNLAFPLVRSRPQSVDGSVKALSATAVGSFADLQETSNVSGSAGDDTSSSYSKVNDGAFDFQRFLDQMKSKSAEPVSRFLRS